MTLTQQCPECSRLFETGIYAEGHEFCSSECLTEHFTAKAEMKRDWERDELALKAAEE